MDPLTKALHSNLDFDSASRFHVGYSGGVDSTALLHALSAIGIDKKRVIAVHVNHRLHENSDDWAEKCADSAKALGVSLLSLTVGAPRRAGESVETWARRCRYELFARELQVNDLLLTAHHRDDAAETFLLQLVRGAGPHGLSGIPNDRPFAAGRVVRPLLTVSRADILTYVRAHGLDWINDPSNLNIAHNRNYIRREILPAFESRWPGIAKRIAHAADLQQQAASILDEMADERISQACSVSVKQISISVFADLDDVRRRWVIKRWIARAKFPIPDSAHLDQMLKAVHAAHDAQPCVSWKGVELRRYQQSLYLTRLDQISSGPTKRLWLPDTALHIDGGKLSAVRCLGDGLSASLVPPTGVTIRFRFGGERCHPVGRVHSQTLKRLFQSWGVPPWCRDRIPIIYIDDQIAAVAGLCVCVPFVASHGEPGWKLTWDDQDESGFRVVSER